MSLTRHRTFQYVGILFSLMLIAVGYWYFAVRAGVKTNTGGTQPQGVGDLSAGLVGYWKLDEGTGTSASDASVNESTGTLTNGPTWTTGQIGGAVNLDGTNDYITDPGATAVDIRDSISLATWVKFDTLPSSGQKKTLIRNAVSGNFLYELKVFNNAGSYELQFAAGGGTDQSSSAVVSITTGTWYHMAATYDTVLDKARLYFNGSLAGEVDETVLGGYAGGTGTLYFGAEDGTASYLDGQLDEVRVYSRALASDEMASLYRLTTPTAVDTGLKGYWSFNGDALSGTTAYDWSGVGNHGTLTNGPSATDGRIGQALSFDGADDYMDMGDINALDGVTAITASAWVKTTSFSTERQIIAKSGCVGGTNGGVFELFGPVSNGEPQFAIYKNGGGPDYYIAPSSVRVDNGDWHLVTGTYDGSTLRIYVDGIETGSTSAPGVTLPSTGSSVYVGRCDSGANWNGSIDEARVYNRALSAPEIKSLYDRGAPDRANTSATQPAGVGDLASGLAGYWKFDEGTGTSASDASVNGNNGTLTNGPTWTTGQIGSAVDFDGTNDYVDAGTSEGLVLGDKRTIAAWIYVSGTMVNGETYQIIRKYSSGNSNSYYGMELFHNGSGITLESYQGGGGAYGNSVGYISTGQWHHVAVSFDKPNISLYIDGKLDSVDTDTVGGGYPSGSGTTFIGSASGGSYFNGNIDELRVYGRPLSADEIANLYRQTAPTGVDTSLRGYWSFNGDAISGTTAYDWSGTGNNGTINGGPLVKGGRVGQALSFDNSDDYVLAGSPSTVDNLEAQGGGGMTASAWIYPESGGTFGGVIVGKRAAPGPGDGDWAFTMHQDGDAIKFYKSYSTTSLEAMTNSGSIALNKWQFVTVTWSGTAARTSVSFYIDGVLVPTSTSGGTDGVGTKDSDASESVSISSQFLQFDGLIDEVRLHNRMLSAAEIKSLYDRSAPDKTNTSVSTPQGTGRLDSGLAGYWKLDDGSGTSATDASAGGNTGTLTNGPTWTTGRIGGAVNFDGTNDYVSISDTSSLEGGGQITVAAWVNPSVISGTEETVLAKEGIYKIDIASWTGDKARFLSGNNSEWGVNDLVGSTTITTGTWYHIVGTYDGSVKRLYVNGALEDSTTSTGDLPTNSVGTYIGAYDGGSPQAYLQGTIDEVRIYNRALSTDEVAQLYRLTAPTGTDTGLKGYWSFNGQDISGTTAYDRSGTGNNGTLTNGPTVKWGKIGQALDFDGTNDRVDAGSATVIDNLTNKSACAWIYPETIPGGTVTTIVSKSSTNGWELSVRDNSGAPQLELYVSFSGGDGVWRSASNSVPLNAWSHACFTYNNSSTANDPVFYVNGVASSVEEAQTPTGTVDSDASDNFQIGALGASVEPFDGKIDEVRYYNRILSASEIMALYSSGK